MIFLDTSAIYALADGGDPNHAVERLQEILSFGEELLTHNYVDHISFLVMRRRNVRVVFAFDSDFDAKGFELFR